MPYYSKSLKSESIHVDGNLHTRAICQKKVIPNHLSSFTLLFFPKECLLAIIFTHCI